MPAKERTWRNLPRKGHVLFWCDFAGWTEKLSMKISIMKQIRDAGGKKWKSCWPSCWEWPLPWICCWCSVSLENVAHQGGRSIRSQMAWWTAFIGSGMAGMPKHLYYDFREMDSLPVHLFLYTGIVQKKQKHFWISMKRQNSTQRIAVPVALCYNETRRRTNRA